LQNPDYRGASWRSAARLREDRCANGRRATSAVALASAALVSPTPEALVCEALRRLE
jgi:hypothetical protein